MVDSHPTIDLSQSSVSRGLDQSTDTNGALFADKRAHESAQAFDSLQNKIGRRNAIVGVLMFSLSLSALSILIFSPKSSSSTSNVRTIYVQDALNADRELRVTSERPAMILYVRDGVIDAGLIAELSQSRGSIGDKYHVVLVYARVQEAPLVNTSGISVGADANGELAKLVGKTTFPALIGLSPEGAVVAAANPKELSESFAASWARIKDQLDQLDSGAN